MALFWGWIWLRMDNSELQIPASMLGLPKYGSADRKVFNSLICLGPLLVALLNEWSSGKTMLTLSKVVLLWKLFMAGKFLVHPGYPNYMGKKWKNYFTCFSSQVVRDLLLQRWPVCGMARREREGLGRGRLLTVWNRARYTKRALFLLEGLKAIKPLSWQCCFLLKWSSRTAWSPI